MKGYKNHVNVYFADMLRVRRRSRTMSDLPEQYLYKNKTLLKVLKQIYASIRDPKTPL